MNDERRGRIRLLLFRPLLVKMRAPSNHQLHLLPLPSKKSNVRESLAKKGLVFAEKSLMKEVMLKRGSTVKSQPL